jgi:formate hydrogenlyase subunit 3/multisubunit Na+/H+ antiporter MnhD subunit
MSTATDELRYGGALLVIFLGLFAIAALAFFLPVKDGWKASEVIALVGALTTFLGTVIGAFLGVQVGSAGKEKSDNLAHRALAALPSDKADELLRQQ